MTSKIGCCLSMSGFTLLKALLINFGDKWYTQEGESVKKNIRIGITQLKIAV